MGRVGIEQQNAGHFTPREGHFGADVSKGISDAHEVGMHEAARHAFELPVRGRPIEQILRWRGVQHFGWLVAEQRKNEAQVFTRRTCVDRGRTRVFAEFLLRAIRQNWHVRVAWRLQPQQPEQQQLAGCVVQQIGAADDLCDVLCRIVDDDRELIGDDAVAPIDRRSRQRPDRGAGNSGLAPGPRTPRVSAGTLTRCDDGPSDGMCRLRHVPG